VGRPYALAARHGEPFLYPNPELEFDHAQSVELGEELTFLGCLGFGGSASESSELPDPQEQKEFLRQ
jgi:hypothetical protein